MATIGAYLSVCLRVTGSSFVLVSFFSFLCWMRDSRAAPVLQEHVVAFPSGCVVLYRDPTCGFGPQQDIEHICAHMPPPLSLLNKLCGQWSILYTSTTAHLWSRGWLTVPSLTMKPDCLVVTSHLKLIVCYIPHLWGNDSFQFISTYKLFWTIHRKEMQCQEYCKEINTVMWKRTFFYAIPREISEHTLWFNKLFKCSVN